MREILLGFLGFLLSACSALPVSIDLLPYLGGYRVGDQRFPVSSGEFSFYGLKLPDEEGFFVDFTEANVPVRIGYASLEWALELALQGVPVEGDLTVQLYLAPYETWDPFQPEYALGEPVRVYVATGRWIALSGSATLNGEQLDALNAKKLRLGAVVDGNLSVRESGTLTITYEVKRAVLKVGLL